MNLLSPSWVSPPDKLTLSASAVHLWLVRLDISEEKSGQLAGWLSPDEHRRAESFKFDQLRNHFIAARGVLRFILGQYLQLNPGQILFRYGAFGKPAIESFGGRNMLYFNLSHSNGLALYAFTPGGEIGVDIEHVHESADIEQTAAIVFSDSEITALRALPEEARRPAFFQYWARKEAFIKATGEGFSFPLRSIDIQQSPGKVLANAESPEKQWQYGNWSIRDICPMQGYAAAIACRNDEYPVSFFRMPDMYFFE